MGRAYNRSGSILPIWIRLEAVFARRAAFSVPIGTRKVFLVYHFPFA